MLSKALMVFRLIKKHSQNVKVNLHQPIGLQPCSGCEALLSGALLPAVAPSVICEVTTSLSWRPASSPLINKKKSYHSGDTLDVLVSLQPRKFWP